MNKDAFKVLQERAEQNWNEATAIRNDMQTLILNDPDQNVKVDALINKVDESFMRKIFAFPNDITSTRIAKVIGKLLKLNV